jgi:molybdopterin-guanine dinucleotide biosynthesis protein A
VSVLGCIIAGGASTRYGSAKALAEVGGRRVVDRVADSLRIALPGADVVAIVNDAGLARAIGLPHRADVLTGIGPLAGLHAALLWAMERGAAGVLAAGCDMPFLEAPLLCELLARAPAFDIVVPASEGRRGVEPLCAYYAVSCVAAIDDALRRGDTRMIGFHEQVRVQRLPLDVVRSFGEPGRMFLNVNTTEDRLRAEALAGHG